VHRLSSRPLRFLRRCLRLRSLGRLEIRRDPRELPHCSPCAAASPSPTSRIYACLSCTAVFGPSHAATHASASVGLGHQIAIDVDRAKLFCAACGDQVYDPDFDYTVFLAQSSSLLPSTSTSSTSPALRKRRRVD
jgi:ubiquitin carboxyl-terminal hydrolase 22/27/51